MAFFQQLLNSKNGKKFIIIFFFAASLLVWLGFRTYCHYYLNTDNAYVNANVVQLAPRITGKVIKLYVKNNQYVKKDQPLFDIDPEPFQLAINSAQAELALSLAELENSQTTKDRKLSLIPKKFLSQQEGDNAITQFKSALAKVEEAKAALAEATLNMTYTKVTAPTSGWITNLSLRMGNIVLANQTLFALISDEEFWVDANFKETEMGVVKPGQTAAIVTDLYPHHPFAGVIESISSGSGTAFSLLPPQNATGNWVKVTQRIPVRVRILNPDLKFPLRIGISAEVTVNLKSVLISQ